MVKTYDSIILEIYEHINNFANFFAGKTPYKDDLIQETILVVLEMDRDRIMLRSDIKNLKGFVYFIMYNSINSSTSPFYKKIKKFNHVSNSNELDCAALGLMNRPDLTNDFEPYNCLEVYNKICKFLTDNGTAQDLSLFKSLINEGTSVGVHKEVVEINPNVSYATISKRIRKMKQKIKDGNL